MKRRINWKFFSIMLTSIVIFGGTVHAIHVYQFANVAKGLLLQAHTAEKTNDLDKATATYLQYLGYKPGDSHALSSYSLLLSNDPKSSLPEYRIRAISALERAVTRDPLRVDTRKQLAKLLHIQGRSLLGREEFRQDGLRRINESLVFLTALITHETADASLYQMRAGCYEDLGEFDKATGDYKQAKKIDPTLIDAYSRLALNLRLKIKLPDPAAADLVMDAKGIRDGLIYHNPKSGIAYLNRARYRREFKIDGSAEDLALALTLAPDETDILLAGADLARERSDKTGERKLLEHGLEKHADNPEFYRNLAGLDVREGKVEAAILTLNRGARYIEM